MGGSGRKLRVPFTARTDGPLAPTLAVLFWQATGNESTRGRYDGGPGRKASSGSVDREASIRVSNRRPQARSRWRIESRRGAGGRRRRIWRDFRFLSVERDLDN